MAEVNLIWAETNDGTIALNGGIPWTQKADLKFFKEETINQVIVMGRNTMNSFQGRALPNRVNLVLTRDENLEVPEGFQKVYDVETAMQIADEAGTKLQIIGGKPIYESFMAVADHLYVTYLDTDFRGDVHMDKVDKTKWRGEEIAHGPSDHENDFDYSIVKYTRF